MAYAYYRIGFKELRPEDQVYFHEPAFLHMLYEHESGYYVRFPPYLRETEDQDTP